jgi:Holliday junction resolvasome RuvABC DNA-binding subunit
MIEPYTTTDILLARVECLIRLGYSREEASKIVAETFAPRNRPPAA